MQIMLQPLSCWANGFDILEHILRLKLLLMFYLKLKLGVGVFRYNLVMESGFSILYALH